MTICPSTHLICDLMQYSFQAYDETPIICYPCLRIENRNTKSEKEREQRGSLHKATGTAGQTGWRGPCAHWTDPAEQTCPGEVGLSTLCECPLHTIPMAALPCGQLPRSKALHSQPPLPPTAACADRCPQNNFSTVPIWPHTPHAQLLGFPRAQNQPQVHVSSQGHVLPTSHLLCHHTRCHQPAREPCAFVVSDASVITSSDKVRNSKVAGAPVRWQGQEARARGALFRVKSRPYQDVDQRRKAIWLLF